MPRTFDSFFDASDFFTQAIRSLLPYSQEEALCYLGVIVERGKEDILEYHKRANVREPEKAVNSAINQFIMCVGDKTPFFKDEKFSLSLRLGILNTMRVMKNAGIPPTLRDWLAQFDVRLSEIFPETLAAHIFAHACAQYKEDEKRGLENGRVVDAIIPATEKWEELYAWRRKVVLGSALSEPRTPMPPHSGTDTKLVPCPECGFKKRVGKDTKRFRCKNPKGCSFDQPYPFPSTP